jgi:hypothetical protein
MKRKKYESLKDEYPEYISMDQMYQICGIAKRSALYLVQNGIVPAIDTGKKTWRYKIALDDVITYLRRKEQWGTMIPPGLMTSRKANVPSPPSPVRKSFADYMGIATEQELMDYFAYIYADFPDMLTVNETADMTGLDYKSIFSLVKAGQLKAIKYEAKYLIPKGCLLSYVSSKHYFDSRCRSPHFFKVISAFEIWLKRRHGGK